MFALWLAPVAARADPPRIAGPAISWPVRQSALCTEAIARAELAYHLPRGLLGAIARAESGRPIDSLADVRPWPWTIDADGTGLFLDSREAAVAWVRGAPARGAHFIDVGCLQVNLQYHPGAFRSLEDAFDPDLNAAYAARFLTALHDEAGSWDLAVGMYHSRTPMLAAEYRDRVAELGRGIVTGIGGPEPLYRRAMRQGTLHLALAGGGVLLVNLHRQPTARPQRRRSACEVAAVLRPLLSHPARISGCAK